MNRGLFIAASGALTNQRNIDVISNNMANSQTPGYKRDTLRTTTFDDYMVSRIETKKGIRPILSGRQITPLYNMDIIRYPEELYTDYTQGSFVDTQRPYDLALQGEGFFVVEGLNEGEQYLTRNGQFYRDEEGYLSTLTAGRVLDEDDNPIELLNSNFTVRQDGAVSIDGVEVATLKIVTTENPHNLIKKWEGYYINDPEAETELVDADEFIIYQNTLENSNTDITVDMTNLIAASKGFQSCTQIVKMFDTLNQKSVTEIGRVR